MRPCIFAPAFAAAVPIPPGLHGYFDFERAPGPEVVIHRIGLEGHGSRPYEFSLLLDATGFKTSVLTEVFRARLRKRHGYRVPDGGYPFVWTGTKAQVIVTNLGKSPCSVQAILGGWTQ